MKTKVLSFSLIFLLVLSITPILVSSPAVYAKKDLPNTLDIQVKSRIEKRLSMFKNLHRIDPSLLHIDHDVRVITIFTKELDLEEYLTHFKSLHVLPSIGDMKIGLGILKSGSHEDLSNMSGLVALVKDIPVVDPGKNLTSIYENRGSSSIIKYSQESKPYIKSEKLKEISEYDRNPGVTMRDVDKIVGAVNVWSDFGVNGTGITVAVVDTGVDYGSLGLGYWDSVARDIYGYASAFDSDALGIVFTNITVQAYGSGSNVFINTSGTDPMIYTPELNIYFGMNMAYPFSFFNGTPFMADMNVTNILNPGDIAHFGIMSQWHVYGGYLYLDFYPVLVVNSSGSGYDTVYVDMSFNWYFNGYASGTPEYSFTDETPLKADGWSIGARDFDGDGIYDLSVSSLGYGLDAFAMAPNIYDRGSILKPIDPYGNYTVFISDWYGHGTSCANVIGGRNLSFYHPLYGPGVAPDVKIMGIPALYIGDIIEGWLWAAGFDLYPGTEGWQSVPGYGTVYGYWVYTGVHKADIISNSWGYSAWAYYFTYYVPWYDILTILEDALTVPGYLDPSYPGTIMVHAAGNGGPGYGTVTEPGYNTLPITVGASTSMNATALYTQLYYGSNGYPNGTYDEVIPWSARGPTAFGSPKPDILGVGAYGWTAAPVWYGWDEWGSSVYAVDLFGGTSMATPVVAGVTALVQSAALKHGFLLTPEHVKVLIKSSAKDLGYDALVQGAGRVDAYAAVSLVNGTSGLLAYTDATYNNLYYKLWMDPWLIAYYYSRGYSLQFNPPSPPIYDVSWFAGDVLPSSSSSAVFTLENPTASDINAELSAVQYKYLGEYNTTFTTYNYTWFHPNTSGGLFLLSPSNIPSDTDLMLVTTNISYTDFDGNHNYNPDRSVYLYVFDWNDVNGDSFPQTNETTYISFSANDGTTQEVRIGKPLNTIKHMLLIRILELSGESSASPIKVTLSTKFYKRVPWTWISLPSSLTVSANGSESFNAVMNIPSNASQGLYHGQILVNMTTLGKVIAIPITVNVYETVNADGHLQLPLNITQIDPLYSSDSVNGYFDWSWRAESGDWRLWHINFNTGPNLIAAFAVANWTGAMTDIDMFSIDPYGYIDDGSEYTNIGGGTFQWYTRTGTTEEFVSLWPSSGPYTIMLHNVLLDGSKFPEKVSGKMAFTYLHQTGPTELINIRGSMEETGLMVVQKYEIDTGLKITGVSFSPYDVPDGFELILPNTISSIDAMSHGSFPVKVLVPYDTPAGTYTVSFLMTFNEIPYYILVSMDVTVKPFPLPFKMTGSSNAGLCTLDIPGKHGTLTQYILFNPINSSSSVKRTYTIVVDDVVLGEHITYISLRIDYKVNGHDWWLPALLIINKDTKTAFLFGVISFSGKYS